MAGDNPKPPSNKRPPSSSSDRKSRWESSSLAVATAAANSDKQQQRPSNNPAANSDKSTKPATTDKPTPKRGPNPSPAHPNPSPARPPAHLPPHGAGARPPFPFPDAPSLGPPLPPPPPTYGFNMLDRRSIVLADGSVRTYVALPPDYQDFARVPLEPVGGRFMPEMGRLPPLGPMSPEGFRDRDDHLFGRGRGSQEYWNSLGLEGRGGPESAMKRKFGDGERERERDGKDEFARQRQQLLQYGNAGANVGTGTSSPFRPDDGYRSSKYMRFGGNGGLENNNLGMRQEVDPAVLKACLHFAKLLNENPNQKKNFLENGKHIQCLACSRSSKDFPDVHDLIMHAYNSDSADLNVDHLGFHRALCVLMGWNYLRPPDNSRAYQFLPADEAAANQDDFILWPPMVIIHNTNTGKGIDGRMEGLGNKTMDSKLRDIGILGGKPKSLYSREGHLGITLIKFASDQSGLKEAMRLADHFEKERHGRRDWAHVQSTSGGRDEESNPNLVVVDERTGERRKILYGYLGTAFDLDKLDYETRKKVVIESKHERLQPIK